MIEAKLHSSFLVNTAPSPLWNMYSTFGSKRRVHAVPKCESWGTAWNYDVSSTLNIYHILFTNQSMTMKDLQNIDSAPELMLCPF